MAPAPLAPRAGRGGRHGRRDPGLRRRRDGAEGPREEPRLAVGGHERGRELFEYLLSVGPNGYNGEDNGIAWKLPVYSDSFGQLDASVFYRISDHVQVGLEMNNLNNAEQRTLMDQTGAGRRVTSWYVNDRRYAATVRFSF